MNEQKLCECECGCGTPLPIYIRNDFRERYGGVKGKPRRFINGHFSKPRDAKTDKISHINECLDRFSTEEKAFEYLESMLWPDGPICPHCGNKISSRLYRLKPCAEKKIRIGLWHCADCRRQFTVKVGTIYEDSKLPLGLWLTATYLLFESEYKISALQIKRRLSLGSYETAWKMRHVILSAIAKCQTGENPLLYIAK